MCHFVREEVFRGAFEEAMGWCACALMEVDTVCWLMLGCVAFSLSCDAASADECKMRRICVLNTALDLAAAALWTKSGVSGKLNGGNIVYGVWRDAPDSRKWVLFRNEAKLYVGSWLGGFERPIFVGVNAFPYGKKGS